MWVRACYCRSWHVQTNDKNVYSYLPWECLLLWSRENWKILPRYFYLSDVNAAITRQLSALIKAPINREGQCLGDWMLAMCPYIIDMGLVIILVQLERELLFLSAKITFRQSLWVKALWLLGSGLKLINNCIAGYSVARCRRGECHHKKCHCLLASVSLLLCPSLARSVIHAWPELIWDHLSADLPGWPRDSSLTADNPSIVIHAWIHNALDIYIYIYSELSRLDRISRKNAFIHLNTLLTLNPIWISKYLFQVCLIKRVPRIFNVFSLEKPKFQ